MTLTRFFQMIKSGLFSVAQLAGAGVQNLTVILPEYNALITRGFFSLFYSRNNKVILI